MKYTITRFKPGDFKTPRGYWCEVGFEGENGEPIKWIMDESKFGLVKVGAEIEGEILNKVSKSNKPYREFVPANSETAQKSYQGGNQGGFQKKSYGKSPEEQMGIYWCNATQVAGQIVLNSSKSGEDALTLAARVVDVAEVIFKARPGVEEKPVVTDEKQFEDVDTDKPINMSDIPF